MLLLILFKNAFCISGIRFGRIGTLISRPYFNSFKSQVESHDGKIKNQYALESFKMQVPSKIFTENVNFLQFSINDYSYIFENAELRSLDILKITDNLNERSFEYLNLRDSTEIKYNGKSLEIFLKKNKNILISNVKNIIVQGDSLIITLIYDKKLIIGDSTSYRDEGNGQIVINPASEKLSSERN